MTASVATNYVCLSLAEYPELIKNTAVLLESYWPGKDTATTKALDRRAARLNQTAKSSSCTKIKSFVLCEVGGKALLGHFRLQKAKNVPWENSGALTSVIVKEELRGKGVGKILMEHAVQKATEEGYLYLYLWTDDAVGFYAKCGFSECEAISMATQVIERLNNSSFIESLSHQLSTKLKTQDLDDTPKNPAKALWMRKRLKEFLPSIAREEREASLEISNALKSIDKNCYFVAFFLNLPWQQQVGPSCGLTCIRTCFEFFKNTIPHVSLLSEAIRKGYTFDGELFNVAYVQDLSRSLGLECRTIHIAGNEVIRQICICISQESVVIIPYDAAMRNDYGPTSCSGESAHYASIIGYACRSTGTGLTEKVIYDNSLAEKLVSDSKLEDIYFIAQQSMKSGILVYPACDFIASNLQLHSSKVTINSARWKTSNMDLKGKCLVITGIQSEMPEPSNNTS